jgi:D-glycero-D-manno-heptose 1,7-bisphosphate phosphatase
MSRAVFLDRDGVINPLAYNSVTGEYDSPHCLEDFVPYPYAKEAIRSLKEAGFFVIVVSNQPGHAKGKVSLEVLTAIERQLDGWVDKTCFCHHHPNGIVPEYTGACECRKPGTLFLQAAAHEFGLDPAQCWFVGDRDTDTECGRRFGCRTVKVNYPPSAKHSGTVEADYYCVDLQEAVQIIRREAAL